MKSCRMKGSVGRAAVAAGLLWCGAVLAGPTVTLNTDARGRVTNDEMVVTLAAEKDAVDPGSANDAVIAQLNDAIARAKRVSGVQARVGGVYTNPVFNDKGKPTGYRVRGEVILESRNFSELASLSGTLAQRMLLAGVMFRASNALRDQEEQRLLQDAATAFRARAKAIASAFGSSDYEIRELAVGSRSGGGPRPMAMNDMAMKSAAPLPVDGGDSEVVVSVSGKVELR